MSTLRPSRVVVPLAGLLCLGTGLLAQGRAPAPLPRFEASAGLVVLSATAVDGNGHPVRDLGPQELRVFDEGRPQRIVHFFAASDMPARLLLLVDASGSMNAARKSASARMAAIQMMAALDPADQVALAGFDQDYWGIVPFTAERSLIRRHLAELTPFGATALHDALDNAARDLASHGEGRRAVVVVTDGVDTASRKTADEVIARSRALDVPIYAISVLSPLDDPRSPLYAGRERTAAATAGAEVLARFAELSGGAAFSVSDFRGLQDAARRIADELKHQYRVGYDPPAGPSRFRHVEVRSTRKGVVVRTRSGYVPQS